MEKAFTVLEVIVVMFIIGLGLMSVVPKMTESTVLGDVRLDFFNKLIAEHLDRSRELGYPISFVGFKGSPNILTYDGKRKVIPNTDFVQEVRINGYNPVGEEYAVRVYPDGICDYFEITFKDKSVIEAIPITMITRYKQKAK